MDILVCCCQVLVTLILQYKALETFKILQILQRICKRNYSCIWHLSRDGNVFLRKVKKERKGSWNYQWRCYVLPDSMKVPHMGWNALEIKQENKILEGVENGSWVYFVHSYRANPSTQDVIIAESDYDVKVPAIVQTRQLYRDSISS